MKLKPRKKKLDATVKNKVGIAKKVKKSVRRKIGAKRADQGPIETRIVPNVRANILAGTRLTLNDLNG